MPRYDIHLKLRDPGLQAEGGAGANFTFGFDAPIAVKGKQKLVNRWLKVFFTPKGSDPLRRKEGTDFPYLIGGNVDQAADLEAQVHLFVDDCNEQVFALDRANPSAPPDERLRGAQLVRFSQPGPDAIEFFVEITNVAGERVPVLIPYATR